MCQKQTYYISDSSITETDAQLGTIAHYNTAIPEDFKEGLTILLTKEIPYYEDPNCSVIKGTISMNTSITPSTYNRDEGSFYLKELDGWIDEFTFSADVVLASGFFDHLVSG